MGTGYKGNASHYRSVEENLVSVQEKYASDNGLFGTLGQGKTSNIRNIVSADPQSTAKDFYERIAYGGLEKPLCYKDGSVKGYQTKMADGTIVNWRMVSASRDGSPAVDIDVQSSDAHGNLVTQKIHFVKE